MINQTPQVVTIAGSDSGGGAGIQADLKTFQAREAFGMSIIVALTAQNTYGVQDSMAIPSTFIEEQFDSLAADFAIIETPAMPVPRKSVKFSSLIPPIATLGIVTASLIAFNVSLVVSGVSLVFVGNIAPIPK